MDKKYAQAEINIAPADSYNDSFKEPIDVRSTNIDTNHIGKYAQADIHVQPGSATPVYKLGDISGRYSGLYAGESKYDEGMPISNFSRLDAARADNQGFFSALINGATSRILSIAPKVGEQFSAFVTAPLALATGDISKMVDNPMMNAMEKVDNDLRSAFPVYASDNYSAGMINKLSTRKFWFDDGFDGLAFSASAFVPASMFGKLAEGLGLADRALEAFEAGNKVGSALLKNAPEAVTTIYNVIGESALEAQDGYKTTYKAAKANGYSDKKAKAMASTVAEHRFAANNAILILPDAIEAKFFLGGFKSEASALRKSVMDAALKGEKFEVKPLQKVLGKVALGIFSEGIWEEGIQNGIQQWENRAAMTGAYKNKNWLEKTETAIKGTLSEYFKGYSTDQGLSSMILGAVTGGLMGGVFTHNEVRQEAKEANDIYNTWKEHEKDILEQNNNFFHERKINPIDDKTGIINTDGYAKQIFRSLYDKQMFDEQMAALAKNDKFHDKYNRLMQTARFTYGYLNDENFSSPDQALDFAFQHLDKIAKENPENADKESIAEIKRNATKVKDIYIQLKEDQILKDGLTPEQKKSRFGNLVNKTLLYEKLKQDYLNEIKSDIDSKQHSAIDNMIEDSKNRVKDLTNESKRNDLFKDYQDFNSIIADRVNNAAIVSEIEDEFNDNKNAKTGEPLTSKEREQKSKEYRKALYNLEESRILHGERPSSTFDIISDSDESLLDQANASLGLLDNAKFINGMRYEKNSAIKKALALYKDNKASISDVVDAVTSYTNKTAPYNRSDINTLKSLLNDSRKVIASIDPEVVDKAAEQERYDKSDPFFKEMSTNPEVSKETMEDAARLKSAINDSNRIEKIIANNEESANKQLTDADLKKHLTKPNLQGMAMEDFLRDNVDNIINKHASNPDIFSDISGTEKAMQSLMAAKEALEDDSRKELAESSIGKKLSSEIDNKLNQIKSILNEAIKNKDDREKYDKTFSIKYGAIHAVGLERSSVVSDIIDTYLGKDYVNKILAYMKEDDNNPVYIDRLTNSIKKLDSKEQEDILRHLKNEISSTAKITLDQLEKITRERIGDKKFETAKSYRRERGLLNAYLKYPTNSFSALLSAFGIINSNLFGSAIEKYNVNKNFIDLYYSLINTPDTVDSGMRHIDTKLLKEIVDRQATLVSLEKIVNGIQSKSNRATILSNEKASISDKEIKIYPSRQQRIVINELVSWIKTPQEEGLENEEELDVKENKLMYAFAYLRGIAGSGKTTVISRSLLKILGLKSEEVFAIANNKSSTKTINDSLGLENDKTAYTFEKEDIGDKVRLVIIDEIGAVDTFEIKKIAHKINELNAEREKNGKQKVKVIMMGDPTQISGDSVQAELEASGRVPSHSIFQTTSLTTPFRSNVGSIMDIQTSFMENKNEVKNYIARASEPVGKEAIGVHTAGSSKVLIKQLEKTKDNGRSKVIIVDNEANKEQYKDFPEKIKGLKLLTVEEVQGMTFDEAYIDMPLIEYENKLNSSNKNSSANNYLRNKRLYTATSRAKSYIFFVDYTSTFKNEISKSVEESLKKNDDDLLKYSDEYSKQVNHDSKILGTPENKLNKIQKTTNKKINEKTSIEQLNLSIIKNPGNKNSKILDGLDKKAAIISIDKIITDVAKKGGTLNDVRDRLRARNIYIGTSAQQGIVNDYINSKLNKTTSKEEETKPSEVIGVNKEDKSGSTEVTPETIDVEEEDTREANETDNKGTTSGTFIKTADDVHSLNYPQNLSVIDVASKPLMVDTLVHAGDKAYYIRIKDNRQVKIVVVSPKNENDLSGGFYMVGVLGNDEIKKYFGKNPSDIKNGEFASFGVGGKIIGFKEDSNYVLGKGKINAVQSLTYKYSGKIITGSSTITDALDRVSMVFSKENGYDLDSYKVIIKTKSKEDEKKYPGLNPGVPYLVIRYKSTRTDAYEEQHVRMAPRMVNRTKDGELINPVLNFLDKIKEIENVLKKSGIDKLYGTQEFNELLKAFKQNYRVNVNGEMELVQDVSSKINLVDIRKIFPEFTAKAFTKTYSMFENLIPMLYNVQYRNLVTSNAGFNTFVESHGLTKMEEDVDGKSNLYFAGDESTLDGGKGRYYQYDENSRKIRYWVTHEENGNTTLRDDKSSGIVTPYYSEKQITYGGEAKDSMDKLSKNNNSPNGVNIRVTKTILGSKHDTIVTAKSLIATDDATGRYYSSLKKLVTGEKVNTVLSDQFRKLSLEDRIGVLEQHIIDNKLATKDDLSSLKARTVVSGFTSDSLEKALGFENGNKSNSLFLPLDINTVNDLSNNITDTDSRQELSDMLSHNLDSVTGTRAQIKIDNINKQATEVKSETKKSRRRRGPVGKSGIDDITNSHLLKFGEDLNKSVPISREAFISEIEKRTGKLGKGKLKFIDDLLMKDPVTGKTVFVYAAVLDDTIMVNNGDKFYSEVAKHEAFHYIVKNVFSEKEYSKLVKSFEKEFGESFSSLSDYDKEEFIAHKYQTYNIGDYAPNENFIEKIFRYIKEFLKFLKPSAQYIEYAFKGIENGRFQNSINYPVEDDILDIRKEFKTTNDYKYAVKILRTVTSSLLENGYEREYLSNDFYPVPYAELFDKTKRTVKMKLDDDLDLLDTYKGLYDLKATTVEDPLDETNKLTQEDVLSRIGDLSNEIYIERILLKNFSGVFDNSYPNYGKKLTFTDNDFEENEEQAGLTGIQDDIKDWATVNMQKKSSASVKTLLSNITYTDVNGVQRIVNPKFAYLKALDLLSKTQPWSDNFLKQLANEHKNTKDPQTLAVISSLIDLYKNSEDFVILKTNEDGEQYYSHVRKDIRFFGGDIVKTGTGLVSRYKFVSLENKSGNVYDNSGIEDLKNNGVKLSVNETSTFDTLDKFIDHLSQKYGFTKDELNDAFILYQNKNTVSEITSLLNSQRKRNISFTKKENNSTNIKLDTVIMDGTSKSRTVTNNIVDYVHSKADTLSNARVFNNRLTSIVNKSKGDSTRVATEFLKLIGIKDIVKSGMIKDSIKLNNAGKELIAMINHNIIPNIVLASSIRMKTISDPEMKASLEESIGDSILDSYELKHIINLLTDALNVDDRTIRAASITSLDGKKKYSYMLSNQALELLNTFINNGVSSDFKGVDSVKNTGLDTPAYIKTPFFRNNIYANGISKLHSVVDYDGKIETYYNGNTEVVEYKDESINDYYERNFQTNFIKGIVSSTKNSPKYIQGPYIVSNKPMFVGTSVDVLDREKTKSASRSMLKQFFNTEDDGTISNFDKYKMMNMDVFAKAIEKNIPGSTTEILNEKNGSVSYYKIEKKAFEQIKNELKNEKSSLINKIVNDTMNGFEQLASDFTDDIINGNMQLNVENLLHEKVIATLDKNDRSKVADLDKIRYIDKNGNLVITKSKINGPIKFKESFRETLLRVAESTEYKDYFAGINIEDTRAIQERIKSLRSNGTIIDTRPKYLIKKEELMPFARTFVRNDYIQSNQITQLVTGDFRYYNGPHDIVKRLSGAYAPGMIGNVSDVNGMPSKTTAAVLGDATYSHKDIIGFLTNELDATEEDATRIAKLFPDKPAKYTDGQGFILPERKEELEKGFGETYGIGSVMKPAYFHIDDNGTPRMLKYSTVELSDDLVKQFPVLDKLRNKMRSAGKNGDITVMELMFNSAMKVGAPTGGISITNLLSEDGNIPEESMFTIYNKDYRMQLNPIHETFATVANPSQLIYFLNTQPENIESAGAIYGYLSKIINTGLIDTKAKLDTKHGFLSSIYEKFKLSEDKKTDFIALRNLEKNYKSFHPWDYPEIASNAATAIGSYIKTHTAKITFPGTKAVLQTAFGTEEIDNETKELKDSLRYGNTDGKLYADAIFPSGLLPKSVEDRIKKEIADDKAAGGIGISNGDFYTAESLGFRLPSSELHSAVPLRIRGFYDSKGTNVVVAPKQIVDFHGSDYDVDSLFMITREYKKENGKRTDIPYGYELDKESGKYKFNYDNIDSENFNKLSSQEKTSILHNAILEKILEVVSDEKNRSRMITPIQMKRIKESIARINALRSSRQKVNQDLSNIRSRQTVHQSSYGASTAVGIWANGIKVISYLQRTDNGKSPTLNKGYEIEFNGKTYSTLNNDTEMYEDLDGFLNTTIDNVKEQDLPELNLTSQNIKGYIAMRAFGIGNDEANTVYAQPVINYINKTKSNSTYLLLDLTNGLKITDEELSKPLTLKESKEALGYDGNIASIIDKIYSGKKISTEEKNFIVTQLKTLKLYNRVNSIGSTFSKISKMLNVLTDYNVHYDEASEAINAFDELFNMNDNGNITSKIKEFNVTTFFKNAPHILSLYNVLKYHTEIMGKNFFEHNGNIAEALRSINKKANIKFDDTSKSADMMEATESFKKFIYKQVHFDPDFNGFDSVEPYKLKSGRILYGEKAFRKRMIDNVIALRSSDELKNNLFIKSLVISKDQNNNDVLTFPVGVNMDYGDVLDFQNAFEELVNYGVKDGKVVNASIFEKPALGYSELQKDLFRMLILDGNLSGSLNKSYIKVIPDELKADYYKNLEDLLYDNKNGILTNKDSLKHIMSVYEMTLVTNRPNSIKIIGIAKNAIKTNDSFAYTGTKDGATIHGDLAFKSKAIIKTTYDSTVRIFDEAYNNRAYPLYIRSGEYTINGKTRTTVYTRVYSDENVTLYQKVGMNNNVTTYKQYNSSDIANYDKRISFSPYIRHAKVASLSNTSFRTAENYKVGDKVLISEFADAPRVLTKYVEVTEVSNDPTRKNSSIVNFKDTNEQPVIPEIHTSKSSNEDMLSDLSGVVDKISKSIESLSNISNLILKVEKNTNDIPTIENIKSTKDEPVAKLVKTIKKDGINITLSNKIHMDLEKIGIISNKSDIKEKAAIAIIHEHLHYFTSSLFDIHNIASAKMNMNEISNVNEYLKDIGLSDNEISFISNVQNLFKYYKENKGKSSFDGVIINEKEFIAYGLSNPEFIKELQEMKVNDTTLFKKLINYVASLFGANTTDMYSLLYGSFDELANAPVSSITGKNSSVFTSNDFGTLFKAIGLPDISLTSNEIEFYDPIINISKLKTAGEQDVASMLQDIYKDHPQFRKLASKILELNKSIDGRIDLAKLDGKDLGQMSMGMEDGIIGTSVEIDSNFINSISNNDKEAQLQLAALILHEQLHRYTTALNLYKNVIKLEQFEKDYLSDVNELNNNAVRYLKALSKDGITSFDNYLDKIENDVDEFITYGLTDESFSKALKQFPSPFDTSLSIYDELENKTLMLLDDSKENSNSLYSKIIQTNKYAPTPSEDRLSDESIQEDMFKCGI